MWEMPHENVFFAYFGHNLETQSLATPLRLKIEKRLTLKYYFILGSIFKLI